MKKIDNRTFEVSEEKIIKVNRTLDDVFIEKANLEKGLANNKRQIPIIEADIAACEQTIKDARKLGIETLEEEKEREKKSKKNKK